VLRKQGPGPSPRARGSPACDRPARIGKGSIPACAGQSRQVVLGRDHRRVHPRVRGAVDPKPDIELVATGPSPRARGSPDPPRGAAAGCGSIPACAGQSDLRNLQGPLSKVHPRVRGAVRGSAAGSLVCYGPSPRARGSRARRRLPLAEQGSIPACAGQSTATGAVARTGRVHPRVRGAVGSANPHRVIANGPSPRARGSLGHRCLRSAWSGSIPACAGQSRTMPRCSSKEEVHPRVRGAVGRPFHAGGRRLGPSPRARGSPAASGHAPARPGSIPACAGQSPLPRARTSRDTVHPRVRGAVSYASSRLSMMVGPSPRARGSRLVEGPRGRGRGSIPACAGQSRRQAAVSRCSRVHPRVRGAVRWPFTSPMTGSGPSPRARGSPTTRKHSRCFIRSIPACAGQS